ncbi:hypothetical protein RGUI_1599 [Rhodovulum sp. P5]|uniref:amphi-Trp domain-containing protein n=1 Tax=Rhodovulum sp. P5 TaxID=1564506 RepID=UPI0009C29E57|nr:amphi-Trp domain-containing protein [Rhodovulum sp. P5]ARE39740.1 hypothetical protein RGUI_1599 [Rhodovulum sp. P5]
MANETTRFVHDSLEDAKTIKTLLNALSKGFAKGKMTLGDGETEMVLKTDGLMHLRLKAECDDGRCQVSLRVSWTETPEAAPKKGPPVIQS